MITLNDFYECLDGVIVVVENVVTVNTKQFVDQFCSIPSSISSCHSYPNLFSLQKLPSVYIKLPIVEVTQLVDSLM